MGFVTVLLTYERTERITRGPPNTPTPDEKRHEWGWVIRINGFNYMPEFRKAFPKFTWKKDQLELTCFEEKALSCELQDQYHPPMTFITKVLDQIDELGYTNSSCCITAEHKGITYCLWNFQTRR